jgi:predicted nucleic acid-binding protein
MIAVSDTSPICYLVLIGEADLLHRLFDELLVPRAVLVELLHEDAPEAVRALGSQASIMDLRPTPTRASNNLRESSRKAAALLKAALDRYGV